MRQDALTNLEEQTCSANPNNQDADGFSDGLEISFDSGSTQSADQLDESNVSNPVCVYFVLFPLLTNIVYQRRVLVR